jgi:hypothetical protein
LRALLLLTFATASLFTCSTHTSVDSIFTACSLLCSWMFGETTGLIWLVLLSRAMLTCSQILHHVVTLYLILYSWQWGYAWGMFSSSDGSAALCGLELQSSSFMMLVISFWKVSFPSFGNHLRPMQLLRASTTLPSAPSSTLASCFWLSPSFSFASCSSRTSALEQLSSKLRISSRRKVRHAVFAVD